MYNVIGRIKLISIINEINTSELLLYIIYVWQKHLSSRVEAQQIKSSGNALVSLLK